VHNYYVIVHTVHNEIVKKITTGTEGGPYKVTQSYQYRCSQTARKRSKSVLNAQQIRMQRSLASG